jgi:hypothetical protein
MVNNIKGLFRSKSITTLTFPLFLSSIHLSIMLTKAVWQEWFELKSKKTWIELNYGARIIICLYIVVRQNVWQLEQSKNLHFKMNNYLWLF